MEHNRKQKLLMIIALVFGIVSLSVGFAAFSTTLTISSSASVSPNSDTFTVKFSTSPSSLVVGAVSPSSKTSGITATNGTIDNGATPMLTNLSASFNSPGQYVEYTVYARNEGEYTAYLNNINFIGSKTCTAETGTTDLLVQSACESINIKVTIGSTTYTETTPITSHALATKSGEQIKVRLEYASNGTYVDGPMSVTFPNVTLVYSTIDDSTMQPSLPQSKVCTYVDSEDDTGSAIGTIDLSDEVTCGTESFYVMYTDNDTVTMLSKYNLYVGNIVDEFQNVTPLSNPTGRQDETAIGMRYDKDSRTDLYPFIGTTAFSYDWMFNYSESIVAGYIDEYNSFFTSQGIIVIEARIITSDDLINLGCSVGLFSTCYSAPEWLSSTSYWMIGEDYAWVVSSDGEVCMDYFYMEEEDVAGVRPVITILKSEIDKD